MGLDMHLTKKTYVGAEYEHRKVEGEINITTEGERIPVNLKRVSYIDEEVGYWRKANHIHNWFVENVQDGVDDCKSYYVSIEDLEKLLKLCKEVKKSSKLIDKTIIEEGKEYQIKVIEDSTVAEELLPCRSGFFFRRYWI